MQRLNTKTIFQILYLCPSRLKNRQKILKDANIIIWTTTPWTIPANKALAYNKNIDYSLVKISSLEFFKDEKIVVAKI